MIHATPCPLMSLILPRSPPKTTRLLLPTPTFEAAEAVGAVAVVAGPAVAADPAAVVVPVVPVAAVASLDAAAVLTMAPASSPALKLLRLTPARASPSTLPA